MRAAGARLGGRHRRADAVHAGLVRRGARPRRARRRHRPRPACRAATACRAARPRRRRRRGRRAGSSLRHAGGHHAVDHPRCDAARDGPVPSPGAYRRLRPQAARDRRTAGPRPGAGSGHDLEDRPRPRPRPTCWPWSRFLLGFHPERSVVVLTLGDGRGAGARPGQDLPRRGAIGGDVGGSSTTWRPWRGGPDSDGPRSCSTPTTPALAAAVASALARASARPGSACRWCVRADGGRWYLAEDDPGDEGGAGELPGEGRPTTSPAPADPARRSWTGRVVHAEPGCPASPRSTATTRTSIARVAVAASRAGDT